jgi:hypothetical protein
VNAYPRHAVWQGTWNWHVKAHQHPDELQEDQLEAGNDQREAKQTRRRATMVHANTPLSSGQGDSLPCLIRAAIRCGDPNTGGRPDLRLLAERRAPRCEKHCGRVVRHTSMGMDGRPQSQDAVFEARQRQKDPHDPMWPMWLVGLHPGDTPARRFADEDLRKVALHPVIHDMVGCRLDCRTLPVLGRKIAHDGVAEGLHPGNGRPEGFCDGRFPLQLHSWKVGVDDDGVIGEDSLQRVQILGLNLGKGLGNELVEMCPDGTSVFPP